MKIKRPKIHIIALIVTTLILFGLTSCNRNPDLNQFITKESFESAEEVCKSSIDKLCALQPSFRKVEEYCLNNKLPAKQCEEIKLDVARKATDYRKQRTEETRQLTNQIKSIR